MPALSTSERAHVHRDGPFEEISLDNLDIEAQTKKKEKKEKKRRKLGIPEILLAVLLVIGVIAGLTVFGVWLSQHGTA